jgi:hypothetical protein
MTSKLKTTPADDHAAGLHADQPHAACGPCRLVTPAFRLEDAKAAAPAVKTYPAFNAKGDLVRVTVPMEHSPVCLRDSVFGPDPDCPACQEGQ